MVSTPATSGWILKGRPDDLSDILDFCKVLGISHDRIWQELIRCCEHNLPSKHRLTEVPAILELDPVELVTQLEMPLFAFQETNVCDIHRAGCTGGYQFPNQESRNDWVWVQAGSEKL